MNKYNFSEFFFIWIVLFIWFVVRRLSKDYIWGLGVWKIEVKWVCCCCLLEKEMFELWDKNRGC